MWSVNDRAGEPLKTHCGKKRQNHCPKLTLCRGENIANFVFLPGNTPQ